VADAAGLSRRRAKATPLYRDAQAPSGARNKNKQGHDCLHDAERIYAIHRLLKEAPKPVPRRRLAEELGVSIHTVKRELDLMRERLEAPIRYHAGSRGYHYDPGAAAFELPGLWFNADEPFYRDNWYLIGWCEEAQALRIFSLDRVRKTRPLPIPLKPIDPKTLDRYLNSAFGIFGGAPKGWAELRFTPERARWVAEEIWHPDQQGEWRDGRYHLRIPYADLTELALEIMKYGPEVEVLAPPELRADLADRHHRAASQYLE